MVVKIDIEVVGDKKMHCGGCESRVRFALQRMPGVHGGPGRLHKSAHSLRFNPEQVTQEALQEQLKAAGDEVVLAVTRGAAS